MNLLLTLLAGTLTFGSGASAQREELNRLRLRAPTITIQERESLLTSKEPLGIPFVRLQIPPSFPQNVTVAPGDVLPLEFPKNFTAKNAQAVIAQGANTWLADKATITKFKSLPKAHPTELDWVDQSVGIKIPQLPAGQYVVYYAQGADTSPRATIQIRPMLSVDGPDTTRVGRRFQLTVQLVGPPDPPPMLVAGKPTPQPPRPVAIRMDHMNDPNKARLVGPSQVVTDAAGQALFEFDAASIGQLDVTFSAAGFRSCRATLDILERPLQAVHEPANRTFNILVLGDSIQWGQGLKDEHKMAELVKKWIAPQTNRAISLVRLAHSGATLVTPEGQQGDENDTSLPGECPVFYPTVTSQLRSANDLFDGQTVDLVIMDGGINDITIVDILNPLNSTSSLIQNHCDFYGHRKLSAVLSDLTHSFPFRKSTVLVTGYFPIVSNDSARLQLASLIGLFVAAAWPDPSTKLDVLLAAALVTAATETILAANCTTFDSIMKTAMETAVQEANRSLLSGESRVNVLRPGFGAKEALLAPNTQLWDGFNDEMFGARAQLLINNHDLLGKAPPTPVASIGHPNIDGEQV